MLKGYFTGNGYSGYVNGEYMLFEDESSYIEYISEMNEEKTRS